MRACHIDISTPYRILLEGWGSKMVYKSVTLKDGRKVMFDWLREEDLPELVEVLNRVIREGKYLFVNNEITDMEEERRWFERRTKEGMLYLVARTDGKIVGGASIKGHTDKRLHVAEFGIFIRDNYRNVGLGTVLTNTFTEIARKRGFEILQLSVYATNKRAFHVYEKCGYRECGLLTRDIKFADGTYSDRILMELLLK
jgi:RimJ/RimL family protein N-acetyltransferase